MLGSARLMHVLCLLGALVWPMQAHAIFDDDEARKAILDLRQRFDQHRLETDARIGELRSSLESSRRGMLELTNQNERLQAEIARLRGQNEQLTRDLSELQRQQKDVQAGVDERLRQVEPVRVTVDGVEFAAKPEERQQYEAAMELLRKSDFTGAAAAYAAFLRRNPGSGYTASSLYWLGNAQFASRSYKEAVESHQRLVSQYPSHLRTPEALLAIANSQFELKDGKGAKRTLEQLVRNHPQSEAASVAKERLARIR